MEPKRTQGTQEGEASGWVCHYHTYNPFAHDQGGRRAVGAVRRRGAAPSVRVRCTHRLHRHDHRPAIGQGRSRQARASVPPADAGSPPTAWEILAQLSLSKKANTSQVPVQELSKQGCAALIRPYRTPAGFLTAHLCVRLKFPSAAWCLCCLSPLGIIPVIQTSYHTGLGQSRVGLHSADGVLGNQLGCHRLAHRLICTSSSSAGTENIFV